MTLREYLNESNNIILDTERYNKEAKRLADIPDKEWKAQKEKFIRDTLEKGRKDLIIEIADLEYKIKGIKSYIKYAKEKIEWYKKIGYEGKAKKYEFELEVYKDKLKVAENSLKFDKEMLEEIKLKLTTGKRMKYIPWDIQREIESKLKIREATRRDGKKLK